MKKELKQLMWVNTALLGLLMLIPGIAKLIAGATGIAGFLSGNWLLSWAPMFWAWVLIVAEIGSGLAILARWKLEKVAWIPVIILGIAIVTVHVNWSSIGSTSWNNLIFHLIAIVNYLMLTKK